MLSTALGELSGTSMSVMPASTSAVHTATASGGVMPRRMAMRWRWAMEIPSGGDVTGGLEAGDHHFGSIDGLPLGAGHGQHLGIERAEGRGADER